MYRAKDDPMTAGEFANLKGLRTVVTGSSSGIGRAIALEFARGGADVCVHCAQAVERAGEVADEIRACGRSALVIPCDFRDPEATAEFPRHVWEQFGPVDVWVNNAGADLLTGAAANFDFETKLQRLYEVDIRSTLILSREIGRQMTAAGSGAILNIGWDQADRGMEGDSGELFAASKNAIMGFTRSLSVSLAPSVRVNCIAPGWIRTTWGERAGQAWQERVLRETPLQRWGTPEDIAAVARFLASSEASFLTGQVINVNGGAVR